MVFVSANITLARAVVNPFPVSIRLETGEKSWQGSRGRRYESHQGGKESMSIKSSRGQPGAPTIADVAREAGFSPMTVSRVINGEKNVRDSTRKAIMATVARLNYSPNLAARTLAGAEQIRIGLLYSNPSATYLSEFLVGSLDEARLSHVQLVVEKCEPDQHEDEVAAELIASGIDGLILPPPLCDSKRLHALLTKADVLAVAVATGKPTKTISAVRIDDFAAAAAMTAHIVSLGHKRIGFIAGHQNQTASEQRLQGYCSALEAAGIAFSEELVRQGLFTYRSGLQAAEALLDLRKPPSAIFASNDDMAAAAVSVAHRRHLDVPGDLTVCGFDDTDFARSIWPELTTIHQPIADMSRAAVAMLVNQIRVRRSGKPVTRQVMLLDFTLVRRDSDAMLRAASVRT